MKKEEKNQEIKFKTLDDIIKSRPIVESFGGNENNKDIGLRIKINNNISIMYYKPNTISTEYLPAIYYIHGGGYVSGVANMYKEYHNTLSSDLNCIVVSIEYRLAPEHQYPEPLLDCVDGILWVNENSNNLNIDKNRISVMGESAGGGLAASLCHYLRDKHNDKIKIKNQILLYPMLDYKTSTESSKKDKYTGLQGWTHDLNYDGWRHYIGKNSLSNDEVSYISPAHAINFKNLPKSYIAVGGLDLLADECLNYARKLNRNGNHVTMELISNSNHGFNFNKSKVANEFNKNLINYFHEAL